MMTMLSLPPGVLVDDEGIWNQVLCQSAAAGGPALFLDRDGVVVDEVAYLHRVEETRLVPGAAAVIARANRRRLPVVLITNQAGIGRGLYGWAEFTQVQGKMLADLAAAGARVDAVYACPHQSGGVAPYDHPDHPARKPNPGMILRAARTLGMDLARSWIVGDRATDLMAGRTGGLEGGLHVLTGYGERPGEREAALAVSDGRFLTFGADTIADALRLVPLLA